MGFFTRDQQGGGGPVASWDDHQDKPGAQIVGTIESFSTIASTDFKTKQPKLWPDGTPKMQLRIVVLRAEGPNNYADAKGPAIDEVSQQALPDDGRRAIYAEEGGNLSRAIGEALKPFHLEDLEVGGQIWAVYDALVANPKNGNTYKSYRAGYKPAPVGSGFQFQGQQGQPQQQAPAQPQYQQPVAQPQPQYAPPAQPQAPQPQYAPPAQPQQPVYQPPAQPQAPQQVIQQAAQGQGLNGPGWNTAQQPQAAPQQPQYAPPAQQQAAPGFAPQAAAQQAAPGFQPGAQVQDPPF